MFPRTSRKSAEGEVIEIVTYRGGLAGLHQRLGGAVTESRDRLRAIPGHRLVLAARPSGDPADDLDHLSQAGLRFRRVGASRLVERLTAKADSLGELTLGHPKAVGHSLHRNLPALVDEC